MKINTGRIGGKIGVRFLRSWRGYRAGAIIVPPAALRQALLSQTVLGQHIVEIVEETVEEVFTSAANESAHLGREIVSGTILHPVEQESDEDESDATPKRGPGRPRKGESK